MNTLLLNLVNWDLTADASGNIAMAQNPYAPAQDVASACRVFLGEVWYDKNQGLPYLQQILGRPPNAPFIKAQEVAAALTVPEVVSAACFLTSFNKRSLGGQIQITLTSGQRLVVAAGTLQGELPWYVSAVSPEAAAGSAVLLTDSTLVLTDDSGNVLTP
jgi:hypothetical protein